jgi:hypothetical protein
MRVERARRASVLPPLQVIFLCFFFFYNDNEKCSIRSTEGRLGERRTPDVVAGGRAVQSLSRHRMRQAVRADYHEARRQISCRRARAQGEAAAARRWREDHHRRRPARNAARKTHGGTVAVLATTRFIGHGICEEISN